MNIFRPLTSASFFAAFLLSASSLSADEAPVSLDTKINEAVAPLTAWIFKIIFFEPITIAGRGVPFILIWLAGTALFLTCYFKFINFRGRNSLGVSFTFEKHSI